MKTLFMLSHSLPQASVAETIPPEIRFRSIGGEHRFYLEHERVYTLLKDVSFLDAPKVDAQEVIVPAGHTISWMGQRDWFNVFHVEPQDCFFVYQVMGDHIDCLTPEGVDSLDEALRLFFANRMWRHCYIEDKNHAQVDISAQIEGFENYLASWDEDGYFDWVEDSNKDDDEYMSDDDAEYEADWNASKDDDDPEWDLQCSDDATWEAQEMSDEEFLAKAKALGLNTDMPEVDFVRKYLPDAGIVECIDRYMEYTMYRDEGQSDIVSRQYAGLL